MKNIQTLSICLAITLIAAGSALAVTDTVSVSASVTQGTATIAIKDAATAGADLTAMSFTGMTVAATNHRAKQLTPAGGAWVEFFSGGGTFELRAWYDNFVGVNSDPTKATAGLKDTGGHYWPHKIWCQNFGPTGATAGPDPNTDSYWTDTTAAYKWIYERAYKVDGFGLVITAGYPADTYKNETRTTLVWFYPTGTTVRSGAALDARLPSRFRVDLGIDSWDAQYAITSSATSYTGTMTFDLTQTP